MRDKNCGKDQNNGCGGVVGVGLGEQQVREFGDIVDC